MSLLLGVLAPPQCVPVTSFDELFSEIKHKASLKNNLKTEFTTIISKPLIYNEELNKE